jgi:predicted nuclease of predicted toxin-antitoxin system
MSPKMKKYLIDANLPYYFSLWNAEPFIHLKDINDSWTDQQIWNYAKENNLTIISKDADFSNRIIISPPPPKVIHVRFGNIKFNDFFKILTDNWNEIENLSNNYKLVNVFIDRIEGVS